MTCLKSHLYNNNMNFAKIILVFHRTSKNLTNSTALNNEGYWATNSKNVKALLRLSFITSGSNLHKLK